MVNEFKAACAMPPLKSVVKCSEYSSGNDVSKQNAQIDDLISSHVDAIVINAASPTGLNGVVSTSVQRRNSRRLVRCGRNQPVATQARFSQEAAAARTMIERSTSRFALAPQSLGADKAYGSGEFLAWLVDREIAPHIRVIDRTRQDREHFGRQVFTFESDVNAYRCPAGKLLTYRGIGRASRVYTHNASPKDCAACSLKAQCTAGRGRRLVVNFDEPARQCAQQLSGTEAYWRSWRERKKVEVLFAELKNVSKLRRFRLRRHQHVSEQTLLAATAQNTRRLIRFTGPTMAVCTA